MKKRVLAALLCVAMTASLLVGCGGGKDKDTEKNTQNSEVTSEKDSEKDTSSDDVKAELTATPVVHYTFDSNDEGWKVVVADANKTANNAYDVANVTGSRGIVDGDMNAVQIIDGAVGKCVYLNGVNALDLQLEPTNTDAYSVSFWVYANRMTTFGPTLTMGSNMAYADNSGNNVTWLNVTQSEWGANGAIFPIVWSRNEASDSADGTIDCWPWMYAFDDSLHGIGEWCMVTLVCTGELQDAPPTGVTATVGAQWYLNGELVYDSAENYNNGTYFEYTWDATLAPNIMKEEEGQTFESYFGINYWDVIFKGCVDDLYVFDKAISASDVKALYLLGDPSVVPAPNTDGEVVEKDNDRPLLKGTGVGKNDYTQGWWTTWSDIWEVKTGETKTITFKNYHTNLNYANYMNAAVILQNTPTGHSADETNVNYAEGYAEYGVVRLDNYGWSGANNTNEHLSALGWTLEHDWDFETADAFKNATHNATVVLNITNNGSTVDIVMEITSADGTVHHQSYKGIAVTGPVYACLTVEKACIDITEVK